MDLDAFEERAAIMEFDGGLSRFEAETQAAQAQGFTRWEVLDAIKRRNSERGGDHRQAAPRDGADNLSRVQRDQTEQGGHLPVGDVQTGRDRLALLALRA